MPVHYPARVETELVAEGHTTDAAEIPVKLPAGIMPASASLEVSTDPDGVAGLEEGLRDLIEYPYGCLEQTTSRLIPLVAVEELAKSLKLTGWTGRRCKSSSAPGWESWKSSRPTRVASRCGSAARRSPT